MGRGCAPEGIIHSLFMMADIHYRLHNRFSDFKEDQWDGLLANASTNVPFLKHGYLDRWWQFRGGGEWPMDAEISMIAGYQGHDQDAALIGIAPFFLVKDRDETVLHFLGGVEISDYLDFICTPGQMAFFLEGLFSGFISQSMPQVSGLVLDNLPEDSPAIRYLEGPLAPAGCNIVVEKSYHTPVIWLADSWDAYLAGIDKKQRHEIRRKLRRAGELDGGVQWSILTDPARLDQASQDFLNMMALDPEKSRFLTPAMRKQMTAIIQWAFHAGLLQLAFLTIHGENAAAYLCFDYGNRIWVYNSAIDQRFREHSPGWVLLAYLIRHAIETGKASFDFMRGDEDYKYRFGAVDSFVMKAVIRYS